MDLTNIEVPNHVPPDLVIDFDLWDYIAEAKTDAYKCAAALHETMPDIFYARKIGYLPGCWVPRRNETLRRIVRDPATFSSREGTPFAAMLGENWKLIPLEIDPPEHGKYRLLLNEFFNSKAVKALEPNMRQTSEALINRVKDQGFCDFNADFSSQFPTLVFLRMMGWPEKHVTKFVGWVNTLIKSQDMQVVHGVLVEIVTYLRSVIDARRTNPEDDLTSYVLSCEIDGRPLSEDEVIGICFLIFIGGLDTVTSSFNFHYYHLAKHPELQSQLRKDPDLIPSAVEELLRAHAVTNMRRVVTRDVEIDGVQMKKGDYVLISLELANLDAEAFECPMKVDIMRADARKHMTFSTGPHLCIGALLARRELCIALETWLSMVPKFRVENEDKIIVRCGGVFGLENLTIAWN
ncbi:cytochrome P450 [Litorimonas sp.]|uniref:cytochrome P450 n=1 Tax=Litorimonas sp. TaxID=1892381 RepID=UPI003A8AD07F